MKYKIKIGLKNAHFRLFTFTIIESVMILVVAFFQISYVKKLFENKRII